MPETKFTEFKEIFNEDRGKAGVLRVPVTVDSVGEEADGDELFEAVAGMAPNTTVHSDWVDIEPANPNPGIILQSEVLPLAAWPASGRFVINIVNTTDVAVHAAFINYEDVGVFWDDTEPHEIMVGIIELPVEGSLEAAHVIECPAGFLYCEGFVSPVTPEVGIVMGRVEIRLQGATVSGGVVGYTIRAL